MTTQLGDLSDSHIQRLLKTRVLGRSMQLVSQAASSNDIAKQAAQHGAPHGHTVVADTQSQGRGSHGRVWSSPPHTDLYVSIVVHTTCQPANLAPITLAAGVAVAETVETFIPMTASIKWPNDIILEGKKCAGLLTEAHSQGNRIETLIIGIGLNVNRISFEPTLVEYATSMRLAHPQATELNRSEVLATLLNRTEHWLNAYAEAGLTRALHSLRQRLAFLNTPVRCGHMEGTLMDIADDGALMLQAAGQVHRLYAGTLEPCSKTHDH
jgi:BirA family biotin operon repressor/biotin-[acetyl-CoA-carboxylase] ligase